VVADLRDVLEVLPGVNSAYSALRICGDFYPDEPVAPRSPAVLQEARPRAAPLPRRLLLGSHDIEAFTTQMARWAAVRDLIAALATTGRVPASPGLEELWGLHPSVIR
jgi:hypothetical protein